MISLIAKECLCGCGLLVDDCTFQQKMRAFGLVEIADAASREVEIPPCTSSTSYGKSQNGRGNTAKKV